MPLQPRAVEARSKVNYLGEGAVVFEADAGVLAAAKGWRSRYNRTRGVGQLSVPHVHVSPADRAVLKPCQTDDHRCQRGGTSHLSTDRFSAGLCFVACECRRQRLMSGMRQQAQHP